MTPTFAGEMQLAGIYAIVNTVTGKQYVGSAVNIKNRWKRHRVDLSSGIHHSVLLQRAWDKYGSEAFDFMVLESVADVSQLIALEQKFIDRLQCFLPAKGYNVAPTAGSCLGVKHTDETRARLRAAMAARGHPMAGKKHSNESKAKMSASRLGVSTGARSAATKRKMSERAMGRTISAEQRAKIAATLTGRKASPEAVRKAAASHIGKKRTEQTKARMSASMTLYRVRESIARNKWVFQYE